MPDQSGKLSSEERAEISKRINARWEGRDDHCPICGSPHWQIGEHIVTPIVLGANGTVQLGGTIYPQAMLISPCGYTRYINLIVLGLGHFVIPPKPAVTTPMPAPDQVTAPPPPPADEKK